MPQGRARPLALPFFVECCQALPIDTSRYDAVAVLVGRLEFSVVEAKIARFAHKRVPICIWIGNRCEQRRQKNELSRRAANCRRV